MRVFFAAIEPHNIEDIEVEDVLLSYFDMVNTIPFRKETFRMIKEGFDEGKYQKSTGEIKPRKARLIR
jgi:hypothetical protein